MLGTILAILLKVSVHMARHSSSVSLLSTTFNCRSSSYGSSLSFFVISADNDLNLVADVYSLLRDSFKDILQKLMEGELDASLGYEKTKKAMFSHPISVTSLLPKPSKAGMGNS